MVKCDPLQMAAQDDTSWNIPSLLSCTASLVFQTYCLSHQEAQVLKVRTEWVPWLRKHSRWPIYDGLPSLDERPCQSQANPSPIKRGLGEGICTSLFHRTNLSIFPDSLASTDTYKWFWISPKFLIAVPGCALLSLFLA